MSDDIEHLKKNKIPTPSERVFLPQFGSLEVPQAPEPPTDAYGGSGEQPESVTDAQTLKDRVVMVLKGIYDPEIPVNIYDLGLIYNIEIHNTSEVEIEMTLTAPACPVAGAIVQEVAEKSGQTEGVSRSHVRLVWDPPWTQERMTEEAKLELGLL